MISGPCGRRSMGKVAANSSGSSSQPQAICGRHRRGGPGVHDVGVADEPPGLAALLRRVARRARRSSGRPAGATRRGRWGGRGRPHRRRRRGYQTGNGHAEEALPADQPVAVEPVDPVVEADLHVGRVPVELVAPLEKLRAQHLVAAAVADEPLPARDDLERAASPLVELHRVRNRPGVADHVPRCGQQLDHRPLRLLHRPAGDGPPGLRRRARRAAASRRCGPSA